MKHAATAEVVAHETPHCRYVEMGPYNVWSVSEQIEDAMNWIRPRLCYSSILLKIMSTIGDT